MRSEKQSSTKALSFKDIEQKLLEEDIATVERLIDELKNKDEKVYQNPYGLGLQIENIDLVFARREESMKKSEN